jgi:hypothetical protein
MKQLMQNLVVDTPRRPLIKHSDLAVELNISSWTPNNWGPDEGPPHIQVGKGKRSYRYRREDIDRWLDARTRGTGAA